MLENMLTIGLLLFLFGLIIGSFLNVVVLRGETDENIGGRSHCPRCRVQIAWHDNIPLLSFLFLRGQCRHCQGKISWQYPLVEFGTGAVFAVLGLAFLSMVTVDEALYPVMLLTGDIVLGEAFLFLGLFLLLASLLIVILVSDLRTMTIPLVWLGGALIVALVILVGRFFFPETLGMELPSWESMLLGGGVAAALFYALVFFSHETWMGMGDVWVAAVLGLTVGIEFLLFALTLSFLLGAVVGLVLLGSGKKDLQSQIPFAPFLILAIFSAWLIQWLLPWWIEYFLLPSSWFRIFS